MGTDLTVYKSTYKGVNKQGNVYYIKERLGALYSTDILNFFNWKLESGLSCSAYHEVSGHDFYECLSKLKRAIPVNFKAVEELERFITDIPQLIDSEDEFYEIQGSW